MNGTRPSSPPPPGAALTLHDVYYILFRHKWKIAVLSILGIAASLAVYELWPFPYISEADVLISYVQEPAKSPGDIGGESKMKSADEHGTDIMNTELRIMTSQDLAVQVAKILGPERIFGKSAKNTNVYEAAAFISENLTAEVTKQCDIINLRFSAKDPTLVQPVLSNLMAAYKNKYIDAHLGAGIPDTYLTQWTDDSRNHLTQTIDALRDEKVNLGITSVEDAKKNQADLMAKTTEGIYQAKAELAEVTAAVDDLQQRLSSPTPDAAATTPNVAADTAPAAPPREVVAKYQNLSIILNSRRNAEQELLGRFTTNSPLVQNAQRQRAGAEADVKQLEDQYPGLLAVKTADSGRAGVPSTPFAPTVDPAVILREAKRRQHGLIARIQELTRQYAQVTNAVAEVDRAEDRITQKQTEKELAEATYKHFLLSSQQAIIDAQVGNGRLSGISITEAPTIPAHDLKKILKATGGVLGFFLALALGLPFVIELFLDQSLKRPADVQTKLGLPFFVSMPRMNGKLRLLKAVKELPLLSPPNGVTAGPGEGDKAVAPRNGGDNGQIAVWDQRHELRPFFEALRDRLMTYFEMINLTHKPKLVAVTSCGVGAGVTTTAAGLASSLSEIGDGNVLLVNMNVRDGEAHHFYKGKLDCGIEEALEKDKRDGALVRDNLYVAKGSVADDRLPRVLPKRFGHLVPMMKASDYDYIIFDMPPVSQISITPRLARFMDMVLLVVESEKTDGEAAKKTAAMLSETKTNVGVVLNKSRRYLPRRLQQDV